MEHFIIDKGEIIIDHCIDYEEGYNEEKEEYYTDGGVEWKYTI